ncbi:Stp1/IreP family PP2C-type Ser/Thr phosphatase [Inmirania thermothiophila]|uniref:Stp1/IreP family PP2C-type Ser/Thr phosphatase n=1 Tax=Inmirania thermothiophila TaxID=1750597 RepID=UPI001FE51885|nr:Stp1/IreP family PP2C-type Ser/Thr phosphatase [Inmirania thermothiophila]
MRGSIAFAGVSDAGRVRAHNEDSIGIDEGLGIALLADGMGGHNAGEVASALAVEVVMRELRRRLPHPEGGGDWAGFAPATRVLAEAVHKANAAIHEAAAARPQCRGMGTTLVGLLFHDDRASIAHVGDSRVYRLRAGVLEQLTTDHTLVQELVARGFYTPEEAATALNRNVITRALGTEPQVAVDLQEEAVRPGDLFLLCSDGLSDMMDDGEIAAELARADSPLEARARRLVALANAHGGRDNISVILAEVRRPFPARRSWWRRLVTWFD